MRTFATLAELGAAAGEHLGYSPWRTVDQDQVSQFAEVTDDHQWIHVDPQRAATGPFGGTIAHGYLMLSLIPSFSAEVYRTQTVGMGVNYGLNRVRFPAPLQVGSRIRAGFRLVSVDPIEGGVQIVAEVTIEREGHDKPCCVAETVARYYA
jgi:acyl dehydratase